MPLPMSSTNWGTATPDFGGCKQSRIPANQPEFRASVGVRVGGRSCRRLFDLRRQACAQKRALKFFSRKISIGAREPGKLTTWCRVPPPAAAQPRSWSPDQESRDNANPIAAADSCRADAQSFQEARLTSNRKKRGTPRPRPNRCARNPDWLRGFLRLSSKFYCSCGGHTRRRCFTNLNPQSACLTTQRCKPCGPIPVLLGAVVLNPRRYADIVCVYSASFGQPPARSH